MTQDPDDRPKTRRTTPRTRLGVRIALAAAVATALVGAALWAAAETRAQAGSEPPSRRALPPGAVTPLTDPQAEAAPPPPGEPAGDVAAWKPALFRLGFGFFAAFCVAYTLRAFLKLTLIVAGVVLIGLVALQQAGAIVVNWDVVAALFEDAGRWLSAQFESLQTLLTGYLPTSAAALGGGILGALR